MKGGDLLTIIALFAGVVAVFIDSVPLAILGASMLICAGIGDIGK